MVRNSRKAVAYAPLYIHTFKLFQPHTIAEAEKFNITYSDPSTLTTTADKLRYYRYKKALLQKDVANYAGIDRATYGSYEENKRDYYPIDTMGKIAELLEVDIVELLDEYNLFLYHGQGQQIKTLRKSMGLLQREFAKLYGVDRHTIVKWETDKVQIFKSTWEKLYKKTQSSK